MAFNKEKATKELVGIYSQAFEKLSKKINKDVIRGKKTVDGALLADINKTVKNLQNENEKWVKQVIPKVYNKTQEEIIDTLAKQGIDVSRKERFRTVHNKAVKELQESLYDDLNNGLLQMKIGRKTKDTLRKTVNKAAAVQTAGAPREEVLSETVEKLSESGFDKITYKNGAKVSIKKYVDMATKTVTTGAINRATINQQKEFDRNLVKMSYHSTSCPVCAPYQGRVYTTSGDNMEYPHIIEINDGAMLSYGVIHPNCQHRLLPYIPELDEDEDSVREFSNEDFKDNRSEFGKQRYKARQKRNYRRRQIEELRDKNEILKLDGSKASKKLIKKNKEKIKKHRKDINAIDEWEIDGLNKNELFTKKRVTKATKKPGFKPAKTTREAAEFAERELADKADYSGVDVEAANEWNKAMYETFQKFPELKDRSRFTGTAQARNKLDQKFQFEYYYKSFKEIDLENRWSEKQLVRMAKDKVKKRKVSRGVLAQSSPAERVKGITVNKNRFTPRNIKKTKELLKSDVKYKFHPEGTAKIKALADHELGHQIDDLIGLSKSGKINKIYDRYSKKEITENLSEYAWNNQNRSKSSEFVAEAWAEYRNNPNPRPIAKEVGELIEKEYKKWKK